MSPPTLQRSLDKFDRPSFPKFGSRRVVFPFHCDGHPDGYERDNEPVEGIASPHRYTIDSRWYLNFHSIEPLENRGSLLSRDTCREAPVF